MGFPTGWTENISRKQRLIALGNSVVPLIPEFLGQAVLSLFACKH
jgi:site-specific DNA-cytosine methylase